MTSVSRPAPAVLLLALVPLISFAFTCGAPLTPTGEARSDKERITNPVVAEGDVAEVVRGNNAFAFDLFQALREGEDGNIFFSPYSISTALAMTYAGARSDTEAEMARTLHFLAQNRLHLALNALDLELTERGQEAAEDGEPLQLEIANSVWGQHGYDFAAAYLDTLALYYGAGLRLVDFRADPESGRRLINEWVSEQTRERIPELIPEGVIDNLTRLVLANAIFFKASWASPFEEPATEEGSFFLLDGREVAVQMMLQDTGLPYAALDGAQAVELPYAGGQASMVIIMPDAGNFESFQGGLDAQGLDAALRSLERTPVLLSLPRFEFESSFSLSETLRAIGMPLAFDESRADFSGMNAEGAREMYIQEVVHKANITVDEQGTEAAAATAVVFGLTSVPPGRVQLTIDRPFLFVIRDNVTGVILFVGRVLEPQAS